MTPAARLNAVLEIFQRMEKVRLPMDTLIGDFMRQRKYIGAKDRSAIAETCYAIMRHYGRLRWHLQQAGTEASPRVLLIAYLALVEKKSDLTLLDGSKYGPEPASAAEEELFSKLSSTPLEPDDMPDPVRVECPDAYAPSLQAYFGVDFADELNAMTTSAPLDLRVNVTMADRDKVRKKLSDDRVETDETPYSPWGLRARSKNFISTTRAFVKGWIDIQDEGSQLIAAICDARPGMQVLDYCAGGGGKTLALANAMQIKGRIVAMDTDAARLEKGRMRFRRAHVTDIIEIRPLSDEKSRKWLRRQKDNFDVVLADVPCTGTGTWRRNPDSRWRRFGPTLDELLQIQQDILDKIAVIPKPGGRIVYATCSILPEENERQVERFLTAHPDYRLLDIRHAWPEGQISPPASDYLRLTPKRHNTDGFFAAVLQKQSTNPDQQTGPA